MTVLAVGLSHHTATVPLLERVVLDPAAAGKLALDVLTDEHVAEAVVLSTCNRVEIYADVAKFHAGVAAATSRLAAHTGVPLEELTPHLSVHYEDRAVQHLFTVACGLDSMVVGEAQILGQVRDALRAAQDAGTAGRVLNALLQHALRVGKAAHSDTGIDRAGRSVVAVALAEAERVVGPLAGRAAVVVGAGAMSSLAATEVRRAGVASLTVLNRTPAKGLRLAERVDATLRSLADLPASLAAADVLITCTGATGTVIDAAAVEAALRTRPHQSLAVLDLALPRDVDPAVRSLPGVTVIDLERLAGVLASADLADDLLAVRHLVSAEVAAFTAAQAAARVAPTVVALRAMAEDVVAVEAQRLHARLPRLDAASRAEVVAAMRRVVDKLLHAPTVRVKELAGEPEGASYEAALRHLFDLDPAQVAAVVTPPADEGGLP